MREFSGREIKGMWLLGFDSGRIYGRKGASDKDWNPLFKEDLKRFRKCYPKLKKDKKNN